MSIIKHVTLQKIVAHDFRYDPRVFVGCRNWIRRCIRNLKQCSLWNVWIRVGVIEWIVLVIQYLIVYRDRYELYIHRNRLKSVVNAEESKSLELFYPLLTANYKHVSSLLDIALVVRTLDPKICSKWHSSVCRQASPLVRHFEVLDEAFRVKCSKWFLEYFRPLLVPCAVVIVRTACYYSVVKYLHYQCVCCSH